MTRRKTADVQRRARRFLRKGGEVNLGFQSGGQRKDTIRRRSSTTTPRRSSMRRAVRGWGLAAYPRGVSTERTALTENYGRKCIGKATNKASLARAGPSPSRQLRRRQVTNVRVLQRPFAIIPLLFHLSSTTSSPAFRQCRPLHRYITNLSSSASIHTLRPPRRHVRRHGAKGRKGLHERGGQGDPRGREARTGMMACGGST